MPAGLSVFAVAGLDDFVVALEVGVAIVDVPFFPVDFDVGPLEGEDEATLEVEAIAEESVDAVAPVVCEGAAAEGVVGSVAERRKRTIEATITIATSGSAIQSAARDRRAGAVVAWAASIRADDVARETALEVSMVCRSDCASVTTGGPDADVGASSCAPVLPEMPEMRARADCTLSARRARRSAT